jgi:hypothetical protein
MKHFETALNKIKKKSGNRIANSPNLPDDDAITASSSSSSSSTASLQHIS